MLRATKDSTDSTPFCCLLRKREHFSPVQLLIFFFFIEIYNRTWFYVCWTFECLILWLKINRIQSGTWIIGSLNGSMTAVHRQHWNCIKMNHFTAIYYKFNVNYNNFYHVFLHLSLSLSQVYDDKKLALHYMRSRKFLFDLAALIPLDILQIRLGTQPLLRFPRFLKVSRLMMFVVNHAKSV